MSHDDEELRALAAAGSLDALTPEERARLDAALAADAVLAQDAAGYDEAAARLGLAVDPVAPAADSRAALMALIATTPQVAADAAGVASESPVASAASTGVDTESADAASGPAERRSRSRWGGRVAMIVGAAAAAIALFVAGVAVGGGFGGGDDTASVLAEINAAPDAQRASQPLDDGRTATLVWSDDIARGALLVERLPELGTDETYEAWVITEEGAEPAGTFSGSTNAVTVHVIDGGMPAGATIGVTVEPRGGSDQPTTDPIFAVPTA